MKRKNNKGDVFVGVDLLDIHMTSEEAAMIRNHLHLLLRKWDRTQVESRIS